MTFYINLNDSVPVYHPEHPVTWLIKDRRVTLDHFGFIPSFLDEADPRPAKEQFNERYAHGGGWSPMQVGNTSDPPRPNRFWVLPTKNISYPGDPVTKLLAEAVLHGQEIIRIYEHAWVMILQDDGSYELCRMD